MTSKNKKELQAENSQMKERFITLELNVEKLCEENKSLRTELILEKEKNRCNNCDKSPKRLSNLKNRKNDHESQPGVFKCDHCDKVFNEQWKMSAHVRKHDKHKCEQCDKTFKYLDIKKKHILVSHENVKLYCHFFNNQKTCPFDDACIFLHEDAKLCRYDRMCERNFCMFKHSKKVDEPEHDKSELIIDAVETISESGVDEEDLVDDEEMDEINVNDKTFNNPSQTDNKISEQTFKCEKCDFKAERKFDYKNHKKEIHNWCCFCLSSYKTQEILKDHTCRY